MHHTYFTSTDCAYSSDRAARRALVLSHKKFEDTPLIPKLESALDRVSAADVSNSGNLGGDADAD